MKFPKLLIPFLAVILPTVRFQSEKPMQLSKSDENTNKNEIRIDSPKEHNFILRRFADAVRFLQFGKHKSHSSHSSHSSHQSSGHGSHGSSSGCCMCDD